MNDAVIDVAVRAPAGEQALDVTRTAVLAAGWPEPVPGTTVGKRSFDFVDQTVIVTGGARGIGLEFGRLCAATTATACITGAVLPVDGGMSVQTRLGCERVRGCGEGTSCYAS